MALITFTRNHRDHSNDTGFQFEFFCDKCGNGHMSAFQTDGLGAAAKVARAAGWLFGSYNVGYAGDQIKDVFRGPNRDNAFQTAINEVKQHFNQCSRCGHWVCPELCWNSKAGMCQDCSPSLEAEAAHIRSQVAKEQLYEQARQSDQTGGLSMKHEHQAICTHCGARNEGGKFCRECGIPFNNNALKCWSCSIEFKAPAKFCPECGAQVQQKK